MVVLSVIGIMAALAFPSFSNKFCKIAW
ncbi:hypothetical protein ABMY47_09990 [Pseudoalteromonas sp. BZP1]